MIKNTSVIPWLLLLPLLFLSACASVVDGRMAENLSTAILNQDDPETVRMGAPAYLLMIDGMIQNNPHNADILLAGSKLYAAYATIFVEDKERAIRLANKAFNYARRALCVRNIPVCTSYDQPFDDFSSSLGQVGNSDESGDTVAYLYGFGSAWAGLIQLSKGDWAALANLPRITLIMEHVIALQESYDNGGAHTYLGVLASLRPASMGGKPEKGRIHFEKSISLSKGKNLMSKVLFARHYARLVYNRELHDRLLREVISANVGEGGLTLINTLAKKEAKALLTSAEEYF